MSASPHELESFARAENYNYEELYQVSPSDMAVPSGKSAGSSDRCR